MELSPNEDRPTAQSVEMIDVHLEQPKVGQTVWGLSKGGCVHLLVWKPESFKDYEAWYVSPKIPEAVKARMTAQYKHSN